MKMINRIRKTQIQACIFSGDPSLAKRDHNFRFQWLRMLVHTTFNAEYVFPRYVWLYINYVPTVMSWCAVTTDQREAMDVSSTSRLNCLQLSSTRILCIAQYLAHGQYNNRRWEQDKWQGILPTSTHSYFSVAAWCCVPFTLAVTKQRG